MTASAAFDTELHPAAQHGMVDIETLGTDVDAPVISIGAVTFDPLALSTYEALHARSFYCVIDIADAVRYSGGASGDTIKWWFGQDDRAIKRLVEPGAATLKQALQDLLRYFTDRSRHSPMPEQYRNLALPKFIWAKSPDFDCKILSHACDRIGLRWPFHYAYSRCVRTAIDMAFPDPEDVPTFTGVAHDARDDAINQALLVQHSYRALGLGHDAVEYLP